MSSTYEECYYEVMFTALEKAKSANNKKEYEKHLNDFARYETQYGGTVKEHKASINKQVEEGIEEENY